MAQTKGAAISSFIFKDLIGSVLAFPLWWFWSGVPYFVKVYRRAWRNFSNEFGVGVWMKNLFVPMYGARDISGRLISFIIRLFQVIVRSFAMVIVTMITLPLLLIWLFLPIIAIVALITQFIGLFS
ncbi:MAG: hypothetical protein WCJ29_02000 [bacterium]